jgi:hypothetical protein
MGDIYSGERHESPDLYTLGITSQSAERTLRLAVSRPSVAV